MKLYISVFSIFFSLHCYSEFDKKCSIVITKRLQTTEDAYKDALYLINQCNEYDILSVTSFLDITISKVYITDLIQTYCMFNHEIVTLLNNATSNLSCVHRGKARTTRKITKELK